VNYYGGEMKGDACPCPLGGVVDNHVVFGHYFMDGLEPVSLVKFSKLSDQEIKTAVPRYGARRIQLLRTIGSRLESDLGINLVQ
jgi:hypothetical protein